VLVRVANSRVRGVKREDGGTVVLLTVPKDMAEDAAFPFEPPCEVVLRIEGKKLIVAKNGE